MDKNHFDIQPIGMIKSFGKVNLKKDTLEVLRPDGVNGFLSQSNGFMNLSGIKEGKLLGGYMSGKNWFEPAGDGLGYDLV